MSETKIKVDIRELKKLEKSLKNLTDKAMDEFMLEAVRVLMSEFLKRVIDRTPVGEYSDTISFKAKGKEVSFKNPLSGKQGGTLRKGWEHGEIKKIPGGYEVEIYNSVEYASHVEYGHRIINKKGGEVKGFVRGRFMMTNTEIEMAFVSEEILEQMADKFLNGVINNE